MTVTGVEVAVRTRWPAVLVVTLGTFLLVTAEQLPIGLLTSIGSALAVSEGTAGLLVTVPSVVAAVSAVAVPLAVRGLDRRLLLIGLMGLMVIANAVCALAPTFSVLLAARVGVGIAIGGFWAVAGGLAVRLVPAVTVPRATAVIFGGVGAANVFGVPLGTVVGNWAGWRAAFAGLGGLALLTLLALTMVLPRLIADEPIAVRKLVGQFGIPGVRVGILVTVLVVTGHFAAYTFVSPVLQDLGGVDERLVGPLLFGFGIAGLTGNFIAPWGLARGVRATVAVIVIALAAILLAFPWLGTGAAGAIILLIAWGLVYGGVSVSLQTWMIRAAPQAVEAASALWVAMFNLAIGLGALGGGLVVDALPLRGVLLLAGVLVLLAGGAVAAARTRT
ncbi:MFS transporter [Kribbella solani]|uniref:MFS transporter n=1 Tax=Kribbella solani TaxID=236067 RepID=UPI0029A6445E|nr:MFS transporter [Kribbella solani]MDX2972139.1 MFS transporter [Kribbella solani]